MNKKDIVIAAIIGEICSWLILVIIKNLQVEFAYSWMLIIIFPILCVVGIIFAMIISKKIPMVYQVAKFVLVGGFNTLMDMGILNLLIWIFQISSGIYYTAFKSLSFIIAVINSYFWNRIWTFKREGSANVKEFGQFIAVSLVGFIINVGVASLVVNVIGPRFGLNAGMWANVGAFLAALVGMTWNFVGYKFIVFKK
ncbi:MAG: GtrA family protein [bacterium]